MNVVLRYRFKQKMLLEVYFYETSRWESHGGNTAKKRYEGTLTFLGPPFTCLVSQALPVESRDVLWIIFEDGVLFPQMLFCSSCSNYSPVRLIVMDCRSFLLSAACHIVMLGNLSEGKVKLQREWP